MNFNGDIMVYAIFKDSKDEDRFYFIAKDIAEHIDIAIDEIKDLKGFNDIVDIEIGFENPRNTEISVIFNNSKGTYSWDFHNDYHFHRIDDVPKVIFWWIKKWKSVVQDNYGDIVGFYF